jgi:hypothetical protein
VLNIISFVPHQTRLNLDKALVNVCAIKKA